MCLRGLPGVTPAGLAALCTPALTAFSVSSMDHLTGADIAHAAAQSPGLRTLHVGPIGGGFVDTDFVGWNNLHTLVVEAHLGAAFTGAGLSLLTDVRRLSLWLSDDFAWPAGSFSGMHHLTSLSLTRVGLGWGPLRTASGLFDGVPPSLRSVKLKNVELVQQENDGVYTRCVTLLRPLAAVADASFVNVLEMDDFSLAELTGVQRLTLHYCRDVVLHHNPAPPASLRELDVRGCRNFVGTGLGALTALETLDITDCPYFHASALSGIAAG